MRPQKMQMFIASCVAMISRNDLDSARRSVDRFCALLHYLGRTADQHRSKLREGFRCEHIIKQWRHYRPRLCVAGQPAHRQRKTYAVDGDDIRSAKEIA